MFSTYGSSAFTNNDFHWSFPCGCVSSEVTIPFHSSQSNVASECPKHVNNTTFTLCGFSCYLGFKFIHDRWPWSNFLGNIVWQHVSTTFQFWRLRQFVKPRRSYRRIQVVQLFRQTISKFLTYVSIFSNW